MLIYALESLFSSHVCISLETVHALLCALSLWKCRIFFCVGMPYRYLDKAKAKQKMKGRICLKFSTSRVPESIHCTHDFGFCNSRLLLRNHDNHYIFCRKKSGMVFFYLIVSHFWWFSSRRNVHIIDIFVYVDASPNNTWSTWPNNKDTIVRSLAWLWNFVSFIDKNESALWYIVSYLTTFEALFSAVQCFFFARVFSPESLYSLFGWWRWLLLFNTCTLHTIQMSLHILCRWSLVKRVKNI